MRKVLLPILASFMFAATAPAFAAGSTCKPAQHATLPAISKLTYHKARKALLSAGWQPLQTKSFKEAKADPDFEYGNGQQFWTKGYVEIESCAPTGLAPCAFLFKDEYGNRLRVTTAGEEYPEEKAYAQVTGAQFVCGR
ncbi:hypothetical protein R0381_001539 [Jeongeupia wiesaeckerbachi]|uniref:hypothetical protein n=1 Tax=Jeongeupia wiesaeckerbachi TaxID=3051218 RepID=UPI003D80A2C1